MAGGSGYHPVVVRPHAPVLLWPLLLLACGPSIQARVETPAFSPAGGAYAASVPVTVTCATGGALIRCTTDGSEPSEASPPYAGPVTISVTTTLKAIAVKSGMDPSRTAAVTYTITPAAEAAERNIILFIGDGMQMENEIAASRFLYGTDDGLAWHGFPSRCFVTTWDVTSYNAYAAAAGKSPYDEASVDPLVGFDPSQGGAASFPTDPGGNAGYLMRSATDSASAATAMATGVKTDGGNISWRRGDPPDGTLPTVAERFRAAKGAAIGILTTVPFNHATPAAFVSHSTTRSDYAGIAARIITVARPEVVVGGGHPGWRSGYFTAAALASLRADAGYLTVERAAGVDGGAALAAAAAALPSGQRLFGLFGGTDGAFEVSGPSVRENPSLADAVQAALGVLEARGNGLFLMAEQGDIDWANHANDYARMIGAMAGLEAAVRAAVAFIDRPGDSMDWTNTLLMVTADHATGLLRLPLAATSGIGVIPSDATYGSTGHTNEPVTLSAKGFGSALMEKYAGIRYPGSPGNRLIDNTDVFRIMAEAAGLE